MIDRRRFLLGAGAVAGMSTLSGSLSPIPHPGRGRIVQPPDSSSLADWTQYFGAVQDQPSWSSVQRGGSFADASGEADLSALGALLARSDLLSWPPPQPSQRTAQGVADFMSLVAATGGAWWRDRLRRYTAGLIAANRTGAHDVVGIHLGNEINAPDYRENIARWAAEVGLDYPHPRSDYGDDGIYRRDHLGYYVEYFLAPAVEGMNEANAEAAEADRIPVVLGSIVGARQPFVRNELLPALLEYTIEGALAPSLEGRRVQEIVDLLSVHYLLTPETIFGYEDGTGRSSPDAWRMALDDLHDAYVGVGRVRGIWHTEEGGSTAQIADQHGSLAVRVFARTMSWVIDRGVQPGQLKVFGWYKTPPDPSGTFEPRFETSWSFALGILHDFLGGQTRLTDRSAGVIVDASDPTDNHAFETEDGRRSVVVVMPRDHAHQGETAVRALSTDVAAWTTDAAAVDATAHLFKSDAEGYQQLDVQVRRSSRDEQRYDVFLPAPIVLNDEADTRVLMIELRAD